jgi:hypothetical protein
MMEIVDPVMQRNNFLGHLENILLAVLKTRKDIIGLLKFKYEKVHLELSETLVE